MFRAQDRPYGGAQGVNKSLACACGFEGLDRVIGRGEINPAPLDQLRARFISEAVADNIADLLLGEGLCRACVGAGLASVPGPAPAAVVAPTATFPEVVGRRAFCSGGVPTAGRRSETAATAPPPIRAACRGGFTPPWRGELAVTGAWRDKPAFTDARSDTDARPGLKPGPTESTWL